MTSIDFDFARYVATRRGEVSQRARDGAAYSYSGERKVRRALVTARPVTMAIEATARTWRKRGRADLLAGAALATDERHPEVFAACAEASRVLALEAPPVYVTKNGEFPVSCRALGTDDDPCIILSHGLLELLDKRELVAVIGHELGHIQNNHILFTTALFYLRHSAAMFVRWIVQPAIMALQAWARRAEITCDRAAAIAVRDLAVAERALVKAALAQDGKVDTAAVDKFLADAGKDDRGVSRFADVFRSQPYLPTRIAALRIFAESRFFLAFAGKESHIGLSSEAVDERVAAL